MAANKAEPKRWGRVWAKPSEYLIKIRKGQVVTHGPGLSVYLWPGDTCTILPTSIQRVTFTADQITSEKVGVGVSGIAVYRIADPLLAFRMLDFSDDSRGVGHLAHILTDMFIGAARRLVANMTVQECLTRRKENIAHELMREIQPVVSGAGRLEDGMDRGWGVVIDTIEIQDVQVLSEEVFAHLQAPYRAQIELAARASQVQRDQEVHHRESEADRHKLEVDQDLNKRRSEAEEQSSLRELAQQEKMQLAQLAGRQRVDQLKLETDLAQQDRLRELTDKEHSLTSHRTDQEAELTRKSAQHEAELCNQQIKDQTATRRLEAEERLALEEVEEEVQGRLEAQRRERKRLRGELKTALLQQLKEVQDRLPEERIRYDFLLQALPELASALGESMGPVHLTQIGSGGDNKGIGFMADTLAQVLAVGQSAGLDLSGLWQSNPAKDK